MDQSGDDRAIHLLFSCELHRLVSIAKTDSLRVFNNKLTRHFNQRNRLIKGGKAHMRQSWSGIRRVRAGVQEMLSCSGNLLSHQFNPPKVSNGGSLGTMMMEQGRVAKSSYTNLLLLNSRRSRPQKQYLRHWDRATSVDDGDEWMMHETHETSE